MQVRALHVIKNIKRDIDSGVWIMIPRSLSNMRVTYLCEHLWTKFTNTLLWTLITNTLLLTLSLTHYCEHYSLTHYPSMRTSRCLLYNDWADIITQWARQRRTCKISIVTDPCDWVRPIKIPGCLCRVKQWQITCSGGHRLLVCLPLTSAAPPPRLCVCVWGAQCGKWGVTATPPSPWSDPIPWVVWCSDHNYVQ